MNNYLSGIAARSIPDDNVSVMPSVAASPADAIDITEISADPGNAPFDNVLAGKQQVQIHKGQPQPDPLRVLQPVVVNKIVETNVQEKNIVLPYITQHIDRLISNEKSNADAGTDQPAPGTRPDSTFEPGDTVTYVENIIPGKKDKVVTTGKRDIVPKDTAAESPGIKEKDGEGIKKKTATVIQPSVKHQPGKKSDKVINRVTPVRITPSPPAAEKNNPVAASNKQAAPKLVIGKIVVEVLPPVTPKVVTRIVQSTPHPVNHSKTNRHSFGLGQL
jgi:hypothetical protein